MPQRRQRKAESKTDPMKTLQRTLTIVKPDAVRRNAIGDIIEQFEKNGFRILAMKMLEISKHQAEQFYAVHNAIHGSDADDTARFELSFFFAGYELAQ